MFRLITLVYVISSLLFLTTLNSRSAQPHVPIKTMVKCHFQFNDSHREIRHLSINKPYSVRTIRDDVREVPVFEVDGKTRMFVTHVVECVQENEVFRLPESQRLENTSLF